MESKIRLLRTGLPRLLERQTRSPGRHLSSIVNYLVYGDNSGASFAESADPLRLLLGRLWEKALADSLAEEYPGEYLLVKEIYFDTIYAHIDLIWNPVTEPLPPHWVVEIKATWRSCRDHLLDRRGPNTAILSPGDLVEDEDHEIYSKKYWGNWLQGTGYCHMLRGIGVPSPGVVLDLCHVQGDYLQFKPREHAWIRAITDNDGKEVWNLIRTTAEEFCVHCGDRCCKLVHRV